MTIDELITSKLRRQGVTLLRLNSNHFDWRVNKSNFFKRWRCTKNETAISTCHILYRPNYVFKIYRRRDYLISYSAKLTSNVHNRWLNYVSLYSMFHVKSLFRKNSNRFLSLCKGHHNSEMTVKKKKTKIIRRVRKVNYKLWRNENISWCIVLLQASASCSYKSLTSIPGWTSAFSCSYSVRDADIFNIFVIAFELLAFFDCVKTDQKRKSPLAGAAEQK